MRLSKTTYLSRQTMRAADKFGGHAVVVASLTRAAAEEVGGRGTGLPKDRIGTLHSHAFRALERPKIAESKEGLAAWASFCASNRQSNWQVGRGMIVDPDNATPEGGFSGATDGDVLLAEMNVFRQRMAPTSVWPVRLHPFHAMWESWKEVEGWTDFTDLIERAIDEAPNAPGDPRVMLLDEAQDMSRLEFTLARKWGARCDQLVTVGDPFQNLYEWRGSDPDAFDGDLGNDPIVLRRSWRVSAAVHEYAVAWAKQIERPFPEYWPRLNDFNDDPENEHAATAPGELRSEVFTFLEPDSIMAEVEDDLARTVVDWQRRDDGSFVQVERPATVMVLATCGYMLDPLVKACKAAGWPFSNPYRPARGDWNPLRGAGKLLAYLRPDPATWGDEARFWDWDDVRLWMEPLQARDALVHGAKAQAELNANPDRFGSAPEQPTLAKVLSLMANEEAQEAIVDTNVEWWKAHLLASRAGAMNYPLKVYDQHGGQALREKPRLMVGTIHSVKGGQADFVYVFPDVSRVSWATAVNPGMTVPRQLREALIRQFYVAFTRAREGLRICEPVNDYHLPLPRP